MTWWDEEKNAPDLLDITTLVDLMLGVSSSGCGLKLSTDCLMKLDEKRKWKKTGWNDYYTKSKTKYKIDLTSKKEATTSSKSARSSPDPEIFATDEVKQKWEKVLSEEKYLLLTPTLLLLLYCSH